MTEERPGDRAVGSQVGESIATTKPAAGLSVGQAIRIFSSGRIAWLILGLAFQLLTVRLLPLSEYVLFTTAIAAAMLLQWGLSASVPRIVAKFGSPFIAGSDLAGFYRLLRTLVLARVTIVIAFAALTALAVLLAPDDALGSNGTIWAIAAWSVALTIFGDCEAIGQLLMQQRLARVVAVAEPALRIVLLIGLAALPGDAPAVAVIALSTTTTAAAVVALAAGIWIRGRQRSGPPQLPQPSIGVLLRTAGAGQGSSFGALLVSPAAVRLVAAVSLPVAPYAAFAFLQGLVISALRFTPSLVLTTLIEPMVMTDLARSGSPRRLQSVLGLIAKLELLFWGPIIASLIAVAPILVEALSGGRIESYDLLLPALLPLILCYGLYRSFETAAFALGAVRALSATLIVGAVALSILIWAVPIYGLAAVIAIPYLEVVTRLVLVGASLRRRGVRMIVDVRVFSLAIVATIAIGAACRWAVAGQDWPLQVAGGAVAGALTLGVLLVARPLRSSERELLPSTGILGASASLLTRRP